MSDPLKTPAWLFEQCLRAYHQAPADKPSLALLKEFEEDPVNFEQAIQIAYNAGIHDACVDIAAQMQGYDSALWGEGEPNVRPAKEEAPDGGR